MLLYRKLAILKPMYTLKVGILEFDLYCNMSLILWILEIMADESAWEGLGVQKRYYRVSEWTGIHKPLTPIQTLSLPPAIFHHRDIRELHKLYVRHSFSFIFCFWLYFLCGSTVRLVMTSSLNPRSNDHAVYIKVNVKVYGRLCLTMSYLVTHHNLRQEIPVIHNLSVECRCT